MKEDKEMKQWQKKERERERERERNKEIQRERERERAGRIQLWALTPIPAYLTKSDLDATVRVRNFGIDSNDKLT